MRIFTDGAAPQLLRPAPQLDLSEGKSHGTSMVVLADAHIRAIKQPSRLP